LVAKTVAVGAEEALSSSGFVNCPRVLPILSSLWLFCVRSQLRKLPHKCSLPKLGLCVFRVPNLDGFCMATCAQFPPFPKPKITLHSYRKCCAINFCLILWGEGVEECKKGFFHSFVWPNTPRFVSQIT